MFAERQPESGREPGRQRGIMATQAVKNEEPLKKSAKNEEQKNALAQTAAGVGTHVSGTVTDTREFLHDVRVEMQKVTWPSKDDVVSTTWVVIATVAFFGAFLGITDWLVQRGVTALFKKFGV
jgi:preprotein translocase subunit SecE